MSWCKTKTYPSGTQLIVTKTNCEYVFCLKHFTKNKESLVICKPRNEDVKKIVRIIDRYYDDDYLSLGCIVIMACSSVDIGYRWYGAINNNFAEEEDESDTNLSGAAEVDVGGSSNARSTVLGRKLNPAKDYIIDPNIIEISDNEESDSDEGEDLEDDTDSGLGKNKNDDGEPSEDDNEHNNAGKNTDNSDCDTFDKEYPPLPAWFYNSDIDNPSPATTISYLGDTDDDDATIIMCDDIDTRKRGREEKDDDVSRKKTRSDDDDGECLSQPDKNGEQGTSSATPPLHFCKTDLNKLMDQLDAMKEILLKARADV